MKYYLALAICSFLTYPCFAQSHSYMDGSLSNSARAQSGVTNQNSLNSGQRTTAGASSLGTVYSTPARAGKRKAGRGKKGGAGKRQSSTASKGQKFVPTATYGGYTK